MKKEMNRTEVIKRIEAFFTREDFNSEEARKIKRLAMKFRVRIGSNRAKMCKKCLSKLNGKIRVSRTYRVIECSNCGAVNRLRIEHAS